MSRIISTFTGSEQFLMTQVNRLNQSAIESAIRLSTGKRINSAKDDPSGLTALALTDHRLSIIKDTKANVEKAATIGSESQLAVDSIRTQLDTVRAALLLDEAGTLTAAERDASQASIDAAIEQIRSLSRTQINGRRLLDGSASYSDNHNTSQIRQVDVFKAPANTAISGTVTSAATRASVTYTGVAGLVFGGNATFTLTGQRGASTFSVTNGEALTAVRDRLNLESHVTGVTASVAGSNLTLTSVDYGTKATATVTVTSGTFNTTGSPTGTNAAVTINGTAVPSGNVSGNKVSYFDKGVHVSLEFQGGFSGAFSSFTIQDTSVPKFALSERISDKTSFALPGLFPELLGGISGTLKDIESGGSLAGLGANTSQAIRIVDEALSKLTTVDGRISAFADVTVKSASNLYTEFEKSIAETVKTLGAVDEDEASLVIARSQALAANAVSALSIIQQQKSYSVGLLRLLSGL